jgi:hypothetical protein
MILIRFELFFNPFDLLVGPCVDGVFGVGDLGEEASEEFVRLGVEVGSPVFVAKNEFGNVRVGVSDERGECFFEIVGNFGVHLCGPVGDVLLSGGDVSGV